MINIYTVKWGQKYSHDHVNEIYRMCEEHITSDFKFFCLTEFPFGLRPEIEPISFPEGNYYEKWWNKLHLFDRSVVTQKGEKLFFDLDVVIQKNIDCIVNYEPKDNLVFIKTWWHNLNKMKEDVKDTPWKYTEFNSSILRWNDRFACGKLTHFVKSYPSQMFFYYRGLDNMFGHQRERLLNFDFFPSGWVYSYNNGFVWPTDIEERVIREEPLVRLYDSMERPEDVKL